MNWKDSDDEGSEGFDQGNVFAALNQKKGPTKKYADDSDESDDGHRIVKTPYEKAKESLQASRKKLDECRDNDFEEIIDLYREITKNFENSKKHYDEPLMKMFAKILSKISDRANDIDKDKQKTLEKYNATALTELRKLFKKNKSYFEIIEKYKHSLDEPDEPSEEEKKESDSEPSGQGSDQGEDVSDISDISDILNDSENDPAKRRLKWVKKVKPAKPEKPLKPEKPEISDKPTNIHEPNNKLTPDVDLQKKTEDEKKPEPPRKKDIDEEKFLKNNQKNYDSIIFAEPTIEKEYIDLSNQREKVEKNVDILSKVETLLKQTKNNQMKFKLLNLQIHVCFDTSKGQFYALTKDMWDKIYMTIDNIIVLFKFFRFSPDYVENDNTFSINTIVQSSLVSHLEKLQIELYKALQFTSHDSNEYISRIKDELRFINLCARVDEVYKILQDDFSQSKVNLLILAHLYYKNELLLKVVKEKSFISHKEFIDYVEKPKEYKTEILNLKEETTAIIVNKFNEEQQNFVRNFEDAEIYVENICTRVFNFGDEKMKIRAMLYQTYFYCVKNRYQKARNLFNRTYSFEIINCLRDEYLKVLYNRCLAQLGLTAFKNGRFEDAVKYLSPICQHGTLRLKDYISQSFVLENEKSQYAFDKDDKKRAIPYIMALSVDEIECTYYIIAIAIELPSVLLHRFGLKQDKENSHYNAFARLLSSYEKQVFNGPPENNKETIFCAATHILKGNYKQGSDLILGLKLFSNSKEVRETLKNHLKITALKCYLIYNSKEYDSFSLSSLCEKFEIAKLQARNIINKMIFEKHVSFRWDKENLINFNKHNSNNIKVLAKLQNNLSIISEHNLTLLELKSSKS